MYGMAVRLRLADVLEVRSFLTGGECLNPWRIEQSDAKRNAGASIDLCSTSITESAKSSTRKTAAETRSDYSD
jgi:hypothetical protein